MSAETLATGPIEKKRSSPWLNYKIIAAAIIIAFAVGFLIFNAMEGSGAYYLTVSEISSTASDLQGDQIKVGGNVVTGSIVRGDLGESLKFEMTDGVSAIPVVYSGAVPDIFSDQAEVIATGTMQADGTFKASELLTKCPSRFEAEEGVSS